MVHRFCKFFELEIDKHTMDHFNPIDWLDQKDDFALGKKA